MNTLTREARGLLVEETRILTKEAKELIERIAWGTQGALYWVKNYPESLAAIPDLRYLLLHRDGRLIGLRIVAPKTVHAGERSYKAVYHSLFAIDPAERGKGYGKILARATVEWGEAHLRSEAR